MFRSIADNNSFRNSKFDVVSLDYRFQKQRSILPSLCIQKKICISDEALLILVARNSPQNFKIGCINTARLKQPTTV